MRKIYGVMGTCSSLLGNIVVLYYSAKSHKDAILMQQFLRHNDKDRQEYFIGCWLVPDEVFYEILDSMSNAEDWIEQYKKVHLDA